VTATNESNCNFYRFKVRLSQQIYRELWILRNLTPRRKDAKKNVASSALLKNGEVLTAMKMYVGK
jgi:hypothetical protein